MFAKTLIAAAAVAASFAVSAPVQQAEAKTHVDFNIGVGGFYPGYYDGGYYGGYYPAYEPGYISCGKGGRIVHWSGFNNVNAIDCSLPGYRYTAWRNGRKFVVGVNGRGNITSVNRLF